MIKLTRKYSVVQINFICYITKCHFMSINLLTQIHSHTSFKRPTATSGQLGSRSPLGTITEAGCH